MPGQQLQIDFGQRLVEIDGALRLVSFFVATLGYSRRIHVRAFLGERQVHRIEGIEDLRGGVVPAGVLPVPVLTDGADHSRRRRGGTPPP